MENDNPLILTVVVVDAKGQPTAGANVSIKPSDASGKTNAAGEVQFTLGNAMKYDITASAGSKTVTVPYYVTKNGATRLVVNPVYVNSIEKQLHPSTFPKTLGIIAIIVLVLLVAAYIAKKILGRKYRRYQKRAAPVENDLD